MRALADRLHALCADFPQLKTQVVYLRATVNTLLLGEGPPPTPHGRKEAR